MPQMSLQQLQVPVAKQMNSRSGRLQILLFGTLNPPNPKSLVHSGVLPQSCLSWKCKENTKWIIVTYEASCQASQGQVLGLHMSRAGSWNMVEPKCFRSFGIAPGRRCTGLDICHYPTSHPRMLPCTTLGTTWHKGMWGDELAVVCITRPR